MDAGQTSRLKCFDGALQVRSTNSKAPIPAAAPVGEPVRRRSLLGRNRRHSQRARRAQLARSAPNAQPRGARRATASLTRAADADPRENEGGLKTSTRGTVMASRGARMATGRYLDGHPVRPSRLTGKSEHLFSWADRPRPSALMGEHATTARTAARPSSNSVAPRQDATRFCMRI
jgi:hypothetical protein